MFRNRTSPTAGIKWTIEQCQKSTILVGWTKSDVNLDDEGNEVGLTLFKTGFVDPDMDFVMTGELKENCKSIHFYNKFKTLVECTLIGKN